VSALLHVMSALDVRDDSRRVGTPTEYDGDEPQLWSDLETDVQADICDAWLKNQPKNIADRINEEADRAKFNVIARAMKRSGVSTEWELA